MKATNLHIQPLVLDDGTILAAARTDGSTKTVSSLSENDKRLVQRGLISVCNEPLKAVPAPKQAMPVARAAEGAVEKIAEADDASAGKGETSK
jgi:hypothetical protein